MAGEVTIIGAGIVGICTAISLRERGFEVRIVDRADPGQETSFGNAGVISPWSIIPQAMPGTWKTLPGLLFGRDSPLSVRAGYWPRMVPWGLRFLRNGSEARARAAADMLEYLCGPSVDLYRRLLRGTGHEDLLVDSFYVHTFRRAEKASLQALEYRIRTEKGGDLELIGQAELRALEPALTPDLQAAILVKGQARVRAPGELGRVLAEKARAMGVAFVRAEVTGLSRSGQGWAIATKAESLSAPRIVLAAGVWSAGLLRPLGIKLPLVAERGYHVEFADPGVELTHSVMDVGTRTVASSMLGGLRLAGTAEFGAIDAPPDPRRHALLTRQARALLPDLNTDAPSLWMGRRPSFPDSLPALGALAGQEGLFTAFGHCHYGLMMAPKTGEVVADMLSGRPANADLAPLNAARFL
jgi:D-amino-acid dehydrogenase